MPYTAAKSPSKNRPGYSISFRHPLRHDSRNKPGLKVRRGLGTTDAAEADALVEQMNTLLADERWWNLARYPEALKTFDRRIADAFYDGLRAGAPDPFALREELIPLPDKHAGYARVLFVGTTGAGKTSLVRQLIGSDPDRDRFPSTSTAKTTVSDIEVIPDEGPYRAAVTFFSDVAIQTNIEDCVLGACAAVWENAPPEKVAERFLNHPDQRFRLGYVLGNWGVIEQAKPADDADWDFGEEDATSPAGEETLAATERQSLRRALEDYVGRITELGRAKAKFVGEELLGAASSAEDREVALEIFQSELYRDEAFHELVQDVMDDIRQRFSNITAGELTSRGGSTHWPLTWSYESTDRDEFLRQVRWFSSNFAPAFGRLLTPLVEGIRIRGPLYPTFMERRARVVLIDGQGLGHTPESSTSVTTRITKRFADVDTILLVDNAEQPVQAAAQSVIRAVAASGNVSKFAIAFTHFDQVKGLNLPKFADKRAHVLASVHSYLSKLRETLAGPIVSAMERAIDDRCFMLGGLHGASEKLPAGVRAQLGALFDFFEATIAPAPPPDLQPAYDPSGLGFAVQRGTHAFQRAWAARLGLAAASGVAAEHWTRIKALNRRIASELDVEYDSLRPVADLVSGLVEEISNFLDHPIEWNRQPASDDEIQAAIAPIRQAVFSKLHQLAETRLIEACLSDWRDSFDYSGTGSTFLRAQDIRGIYEWAAPVPGTINTEASLEFMRAVRSIVDASVRAHGGEMRLTDMA